MKPALVLFGERRNCPTISEKSGRGWGRDGLVGGFINETILFVFDNRISLPTCSKKKMRDVGGKIGCWVFEEVYFFPSWVDLFSDLFTKSALIKFSEKTGLFSTRRFMRK